MDALSKLGAALGARLIERGQTVAVAAASALRARRVSRKLLPQSVRGAAPAVAAGCVWA